MVRFFYAFTVSRKELLISQNRFVKFNSNSMTLESSMKWFDNKPLLIAFLFILPPVGVIGILKRNSKLWKKLLYTFFALLSSIVLLVVILAVFNPIDYYKSGIENFNSCKYELAIKDFEKVGSKDENYKDAVSKIVIANKKIKELSIVKEKANNEKLSAIQDFQKTWSDSVVKSNNGFFIVDSKLSLPDTIFFELSEGATKSINSNKRDNLPLYIKAYQIALKKRFGNEYNSIKTIIDFKPNQNLLKNYNSNEWSHPIILNKGLKIYSGNEYSKDYLGKLNCKYKDKTDGKSYYVITKENGNEARILDYEFKNYYWVKKSDPNYNSAIGLTKCNY